MSSQLIDDILFEVNCAVFRAMDQTLNEQLGVNRKVWIVDEQLPRLIPAIEAATLEAMRKVGILPANTGKE